jgi:hypothetical protein
VTTTPPGTLLRRFLAADATAIDLVVTAAHTCDDPNLLVAAALVGPDWRNLLDRAASAATSGRDRRLVAVAAAHLRGDADRALLLARDYLADHPDDLLVAHIAASPPRVTSQPSSRTTSQTRTRP